MKAFTNCIMLLLACSAGVSAEESKWWKGNLHTHSLWSDGDDYPEMIADWYRENGYHFLGISDHNILAEGNRWIHAEKNAGGRLAFEKYLKKFGSDWVEHKTENNVPKVRLKNFSEYKAKMSIEGKFLLLQAEELTDRFQGFPIHINATNLKNYIPPQGGTSLFSVIQNNVNAVIKQREKTGQLMFPHINHPNFGWALKPTDMIQLKGEKFFEVYNGHPAVNNYGDAKHLSTVQIWDIINAYRIGVHKLPLMFGLATDDAHNYHQIAVGKSNTGRGWVMVRAAKLNAAALVTSMEKGDFYSSTGVTLKSLKQTSKEIDLTIKAEAGVHANATSACGAEAASNRAAHAATALAVPRPAARQVEHHAARHSTESPHAAPGQMATRVRVAVASIAIARGVVARDEPVVSRNMG